MTNVWGGWEGRESGHGRKRLRCEGVRAGGPGINGAGGEAGAGVPKCVAALSLPGGVVGPGVKQLE